MIRQMVKVRNPPNSKTQAYQKAVNDSGRARQVQQIAQKTNAAMKNKTARNSAGSIPEQSERGGLQDPTSPAAPTPPQNPEQSLMPAWWTLWICAAKADRGRAGSA